MSITRRPDVLDSRHFRPAFGAELAVYAPIGYILPSRLRKYEEIYDTQVEGGRASCVRPIANAACKRL